MLDVQNAPLLNCPLGTYFNILMYIIQSDCYVVIRCWKYKMSRNWNDVLIRLYTNECNEGLLGC
jgi:hypothetical protein